MRLNKIEVEQILDNYPYKIKIYSSKDVFALTGDRVTDLAIVFEGILVTNMVSDSGKFIQIDRLTKGRVVAPAMLFAENNRYPVNVIPLNDVVVFMMYKDHSFSALQQNKKLFCYFIQIISDMNRFLQIRSI